MAKKRRTATTPEARENQMISYAMDLAEQQILDGTASSQVITHFLKLGTEKERLEREKLKQENELLKAKAHALESSEEMKTMYEEAIKAMRTYSGNGDPDDY
jgi:hypothetical protein|nr:MAG TPA: hypothetical protein [Caudoviricetes sp.]